MKVTLAHPLTAVLVGAAVSAVPALTAVYIQVRSQRNEARAVRQIQALDAYVTACNNFIMTGRRMDDFIQIQSNRAATRSRVPPGTIIVPSPDFLPDPSDDYPTIRLETMKVALELRTRSDIASLTFGTPLSPFQLADTSQGELMPPLSDSEGIQKFLERRNQARIATETKCNDDARTLMSMVGK